MDHAADEAADFLRGFFCAILHLFSWEFGVVAAMHATRLACCDPVWPLYAFLCKGYLYSLHHILSCVLALYILENILEY